MFRVNFRQSETISVDSHVKCQEVIDIWLGDGLKLYCFTFRVGLRLPMLRDQNAPEVHERQATGANYVCDEYLCRIPNRAALTQSLLWILRAFLLAICISSRHLQPGQQGLRLGQVICRSLETTHYQGTVSTKVSTEPFGFRSLPSSSNHQVSPQQIVVGTLIRRFRSETIRTCSGDSLPLVSSL